MAADYDQKPETLNLAVKRGDDLAPEITITVGCSGTTPFAITDYTVTSEVLSLVTGDVVRTVTTSIVNGPGGVLRVSLPESEQAELPVGSYGWRLRWRSPSGVNRTPYAGVFEVRR